MKKHSDYVILGIVTLIVLYLCSLYNYLLFHCIAEIFSIVIACGIFMIAWNSRQFFNNNYLLFLGIAYLFIGGLDLIHTMAFEGMGIFPDYHVNLPTQMWMGSRFLESFSLLAAPAFLKRKLKVKFVFFCFLMVFAIFLLSIFKWDIFPICFVEGKGLTTFKIAGEYAISMILLLSMVLIYKNRDHFDPEVLRWVLFSISLNIASELMFTLYISSHGMSNFLGHYFKIGSFYFIYKAIIETALSKPYNLMFRELKQSRERYRSLFTHMINGFARHQIILDAAGKPVDYRFIEVNDTFESLTGLKKDHVSGKRASEVIPGIENDPADWINIFGKVALTGEAIRFENYAEPLKRWYSVIAFSPEKEFFVTVFEDITHRKQIEEALIQAKDELELRVRERTAELEYANVKLQRSQNELRNLSGRLLTTQEEERKRIACEIHDSMGSCLTAIKFTLESISAAEEPDSRIAKSIQSLVRMTQQAIEEAREMIVNLRPALLDDLGLISTIQWFCDRFESIYSGIQIKREIFIDEDHVPENLKIVIFRIMQETFNNIAKYSHAQLVELSFGMVDNAIVLSIKDSGRGFDLKEVFTRDATKTGLGLTSMRERAELSGGRFHIETSPAKGTHVRTWWPKTPPVIEQKKAG